MESKNISLYNFRFLDWENCFRWSLIRCLPIVFRRKKICEQCTLSTIVRKHIWKSAPCLGTRAKSPNSLKPSPFSLFGLRTLLIEKLITFWKVNFTVPQGYTLGRLGYFLLTKLSAKNRYFDLWMIGLLFIFHYSMTF